VLANLGAEDVMVVHGEDGRDEITITDGTRVSRLVGGKVENSFISPEDFGMRRADVEEIAGGDKEANAKITLSVLKGEAGPGRDIVLMNAAAALEVAGRAPHMSDGIQMAAEAIDSGRALEKLEEIKNFTMSA
jgi:anthranilate phosphoribosyltransferase